MKVEFLEKVMHRREVFEAEDQRTVPDELGKYFCEMGWSKDLSGQCATGERNTNEVRLAPDNVAHGVKSTEI